MNDYLLKLKIALPSEERALSLIEFSSIYTETSLVIAIRELEVMDISEDEVKNLINYFKNILDKYKETKNVD